MHSITKQYRTETGHRLHPYSGKCSHFHGHSYLWEVTVKGPFGTLGTDGMVTDFKVVKKAMVEVLEPLDHAMILSQDDPLVVDAGEALGDTLRATNGAEPRLFVVPFNPTAENLAEWTAGRIQGRLPGNINLTRLVVWETATSFATWES